MKIDFNRIILAVASISLVIALTVTVFTKEVFPLMGVALVIFFLSPVGLLCMTFYNSYLKKKDKNRFLPVDNSENLRAVFIYLAGFFVILLTPFIIGLVISIIISNMGLYRHSEENLLMIPLNIAIVISVTYIIMLENRKKLDDIQSMDTLKNSFFFMQLFTAGIIVFSAILVHSIVFELPPDNIFENLKYLTVLGLTGIFSMPYMLFFNVISHIARPKADPYNE
jgi:flagellar biosynthesis protein FlhB